MIFYCLWCIGKSPEENKAPTIIFKLMHVGIFFEWASERNEKAESEEAWLSIPNSLRNANSHKKILINNIILIWKMKWERVNLEKAEYRSVRQRRLRKEEQKEKLQNRADIWGKLANIQFDKLRKLELPYQVAAW